MKKQTLLTKSRYIEGLKCKKMLWLEFNAREMKPKVDEATQHRFDEGKIVGDLAKKLFPKGVEVNERYPNENDYETRERLNDGKILFEAGLLHKNKKCYARADALVPVAESEGEWDVYEVKSGNSVKEDHIQDVAFQKWCYENSEAGIKIRKCFIVHLNNQYIREGEIEPKELFVISEITDEVESLIDQVEGKVKALFEIIALENCPEMKPGDYCCGNETGIHDEDKFWKEHPECNILDLHRGGEKAIELFNSGVLTIKDIPESHLINEKQKIQHKTEKTGKHHCKVEDLESFVNKLKYPLYFLDFETYMRAVPPFDGLHPYQQIPFQFSLHVVKKKGAKPEHYSFIAEGKEDPRPKLARRLKELLGNKEDKGDEGDKGSIIAYFMSFEKGVIKALGEFMPKYAKWAESIAKRMVDLYAPFGNFAYYHPEQRGSASLKAVLPVLTGMKYDDFEIAEGQQASLSYLFMINGDGEGNMPTDKEAEKIKHDLEEYCGLDTEGMVMILEKLEKLIE